MAFDAEKVPVEHADLFYHGRPGADGKPVGLTDEQYDGLKAELQARDEWPFDRPEEED